MVGYAFSLELLLLLVTLGNFPIEKPLLMKTVTWKDSSSAGKHLKYLQTIDQSFCRKKYPHDADLLAHIQWLWSQLTMELDHKICWVKSHHDRTSTKYPLPRNAQLNISAYALASKCLNEGIPPPRSSPLSFPTCPINLVVNGLRITAHIKDSIRININGTIFYRYLQKSRGWTDSTWEMIDFSSLGLARNLLP